MRRHETDAVSLVPALVFLGLAGWWALDRLTTVDLPLAWLTALTLLVAGAVGLVVTLTRGRKAPGGTSGTPMGRGTDDSTDPAHDHADDDGAGAGPGPRTDLGGPPR